MSKWGFILVQKLPNKAIVNELNNWDDNNKKTFLTFLSVPIQHDELHNVLHDTHDSLPYQLNEDYASLQLCMYLHPVLLFI